MRTYLVSLDDTHRTYQAEDSNHALEQFLDSIQSEAEVTEVEHHE